jgi:hypothetical protein
MLAESIALSACCDATAARRTLMAYGASAAVRVADVEGWLLVVESARTAETSP